MLTRRRFLKYAAGGVPGIGIGWKIADKMEGRALASNPAALEKLKHTFTLTEPLEMKVGEHLPADLEVMDSCNNIDAVRHEGTYYLGFRTAPSHFASDRTLMHILRSDNGKKWTKESTIAMGSDLREPRFLSLNGQLFFYFFRGGADWEKFEPQEMYMMEKTKKGWSEPEEFGEPGFVPWRARTHNGKGYLSAYYGRDIYETGEIGRAFLLQSDDGKNWQQFSEDIREARVEELEFIFDEQGEIWGTVRFEGEGGGIVHAADAKHFDLHKTSQKYDSALLFNHDGEMYLIARRNPSGINNLYLYSMTEKRTALYHVDRKNMNIEFLFDLPSHGDTAFPALAPIDANRFLLYNYSSPLEGDRDYAWCRGQINPTHIYLQEMKIEKK